MMDKVFELTYSFCFSEKKSSQKALQFMVEHFPIGKYTTYRISILFIRL